jgi:tRNA(fMet)-specific endonuclease VapC
MVYMLDTNIVSDIVRNSSGKAAKRFAAAGDGELCTSIIVAAESRFGVLKKASPVLAKRVDDLLTQLPVIPFESPADECYAYLRAILERSGTPIGANDMLIAAHALALGCTLVTDNEREFSRVEALKIENWLR